MMKKDKTNENEVYILGSEVHGKKNRISRTAKWIILAVCLILAAIAIFMLAGKKEQAAEYYFEPEETSLQTVTMPTDSTDKQGEKGYLEIAHDTINDVPLKIYTPYQATMSLTLGIPDISDSTIIFATMAADIQKDNQKIVGDFVLAGQRLSRGIAKKGFCAIIDNTISVGIGTETPLLQQAMDNNGYFFRQYPLVDNGQLVENNPKNKSIRRALAVRDQRIIMVESCNRESFHDFSQALIDIGVSDAIYLVGGKAYGWYRDKEHVRQEYGEKLPETPETISYIVWKVK